MPNEIPPVRVELLGLEKVKALIAVLREVVAMLDDEPSCNCCHCQRNRILKMKIKQELAK